MTRLFTRAFVMVSLANFLQGMAVHAYLHVPGFFETRLGASEFLVGSLYALMACSGIFSRPGVGRAMDRLGRRPVILFGAVLHVLVCLSYLTVDRLGPWIVIIRLAHGVANGALFSSLFTHAADIIPAGRRTQGIAVFGVSGLIPVSLGSLMGDAVIAAGGYDALFLTTAAIAGIALLVSLGLADVPPEPHADRARGFLAAAGQADLVPLWFVGTVFAFGLSGVFVFLKLYLLETQSGPLGPFFTAYAVTAAILRLGFGWVPDRVGLKRTMAPAVLCISAGLAILALGVSPSHVLAAGVLCGAGHGFAFPILSSLVVSRARSSERGVAMAMFTAVFDLGMLVGGPVLGLSVNRLGYPWMYTIAATVTTVGLIGYLVWDRER